MTTSGPAGTTADRAFMRRAVALARRGWGRVAPNPLVGAVVVRDGVVVGEGFHARYGGPHAEVVALESAGHAARGATLYVTLEPCRHHGRTPPCTDAVLHAGIGRVVVGTLDPNPTAGGGLELLASRGLATLAGVEEEAARELDPAFFFRFAADRPWVVLKLALSLDGALADHTRRPGWLTNDRSRRAVHRLRAGMDAVAVGIGTVLADDPLLTVRAGRPPRRPPARVVFDRSARLPLGSALVRTAGESPVIVCTACSDSPGARALAGAGVELLPADDLIQALRRLRQRDIHSVMVEGGAGMAGALLQHDLVDRLVIFQAPVILGAGAVGAFTSAPAASASGARRLRVVARRRFGDDLMTEYALTQSPTPTTAVQPCSPD
ncbi:MAG: bifunctional diaminohydroxyphosphoribosylaminopyrimidine deaminase/5-amino-6-(5-phosphoribosylamino)uracil reductase RibD [Gemmatimonadaceae bacterium]